MNTKLKNSNPVKSPRDVVNAGALPLDGSVPVIRQAANSSQVEELLKLPPFTGRSELFG